MRGLANTESAARERSSPTQSFEILTLLAESDQGAKTSRRGGVGSPPTRWSKIASAKALWASALGWPSRKTVRRDASWPAKRGKRSKTGRSWLRQNRVTVACAGASGYVAKSIIIG